MSGTDVCRSIRKAKNYILLLFHKRLLVVSMNGILKQYLLNSKSAREHLLQANVIDSRFSSFVSPNTLQSSNISSLHSNQINLRKPPYNIINCIMMVYYNENFFKLNNENRIPRESERQHLLISLSYNSIGVY